MAYGKLNKFLDLYWQQVEEKENAKKKLKETKRDIAELIGAHSGKLTEEELEEFEGIEIVANDENRTAITNFLSQSVSADWDYLEKVLTSRQLKRAKKVSKFAALKFTADSKKELTED